MISDVINSLDVQEIVNFIIPSKEDLDNILKKLKNSEDLDSYDMLVLERIRVLKKLLERSRKNV